MFKNKQKAYGREEVVQFFNLINMEFVNQNVSELPLLSTILAVIMMEFRPSY